VAIPVANDFREPGFNVARKGTTPEVGPPGAYNIAGDGVVTVSEVARAPGGRPLRVAASAASAAISKEPFVPSMLEWPHVARTSVVMDTGKARSLLGWQPVHSSEETLAALAGAV
jgi:UDP-glucose 4-epimerase